MSTDHERADHTLITGASSGIGRATAIRLAEQRRLILHGRNLERLQETREACARSDEHLVWPWDFSEIEGVAESLIQFLAQNATVVDCFVHCAGMVKVLPMRSVGYKLAQEMMNVNVISATEVLRVLLSKRTNGGRLRSIVFISSIASEFGAPGFGLYAATKGALDSLMTSVAVECAPDVRANSVLLGAIASRVPEPVRFEQTALAKLAQAHPLGMGDVAAVADVVQFLVSDGARWITGQRMVVDGGRTVNIASR